MEILRAYRVKCIDCGEDITVVLEKGERLPRQKDLENQRNLCWKCHYRNTLPTGYISPSGRP